MRSRCTLVVVLLVAVAGPVATAQAGTVKVRSVSAPRSATAGASTTVDVTVARKGRTRATALSFYLSANAKRDGQDARLKGSAKVAKGRRSGSAHVGAELTVPAGQALGAYRVLACAGKSCAASRPLTVTGRPVGTRELVAQAVAAGKLSPEQGLVYRAFAAFDDHRLLPAYAGDDAAHEDSIMREVAESWPKLSTAQRKQVEPFFIPPAAKGSWASASAARATAAADEPACGTGRFAARGWVSTARKDGHVRIWWRAVDRDRFAARARALLNEAEDTIWRKLWDVFGRDALTDEGESCFHGPDGKLDIYLTRRGEGQAQAKASAVNYPGACSGTPAYIVFNAGGSPPTRWELAHELTHAFQYAFPVSGCASWDNFDESVATWGAQYIYPRDDQEHRYVWFTKEPDMPLADASYDGWVFPYALEQLIGPGVMQRIYEQGATHDAMHAIDEGVPGGLAKVYPEFAKLAWNHDPVKPSFWDWDGFDPVPEDAHGAEIAPEHVDPGAAGQQEADLTQPLKPLSRAYKHLKFGPGITEVSVAVPHDENLHVDVLMKLRNGSVETEDLSKRQATVFCPEAAGERIDELVLVASNTSTFRQMAQDKPIRVVGTNLGCARYVGSVTGTQTYRTQSADTTESWTGTGLVFQRSSTGVKWDANLNYKLVGGTVTWKYSGTNQGCSYNAGPVTFQVPSDGSMGSLQALAWNIYPDKPVRGYYALGWNLPPVPVTITCPTATSTTTMRPHEFLKTGDPTARPDVPGDGVLKGSWTNEEHSGGAYHETYDWRLEPQP